MNYEDIQCYLSLCDISLHIGIISPDVYEERLFYLVLLSKGDFNKNRLLLEKLKLELEEHTEVKEHTKVFEIPEKKLKENEDQNRFSLVTIHTGKYGKWILAGISDPDPEPSIPHLHGVGKYANLKLDPYTGKVYEGKHLIGREDIDIIRGIWQHNGFRNVATNALKTFKEENNQKIFERYLNKRNLSEGNFYKIPQKRSKKVKKVFKN